MKKDGGKHVLPGEGGYMRLVATQRGGFSYKDKDLSLTPNGESFRLIPVN